MAPARGPDGSESVLKLVVPRDVDHTHARAEIDALEISRGDGIVALLRSDPGRGALLLERLGRPLVDLGLPLEGRHDVLCATARRVWRPAPGCGLETGAEKGRRLAEIVVDRWEQLDHPCSERAVDHAIACAARRVAAHDDERAVFVHGDVHQWNTLEAGARFKLVDPDGLLAEPEYDLGVVLREDPVEVLAGDPEGLARRLAARTGLDATAVWEWAVVERVSTGLLGVEVGLAPGRDMLAAADELARRSTRG